MESFVIFFNTHAFENFKGSLINPSYRAVLDLVQNDPEENWIVFEAIRQAYKQVSDIQEPFRWNSAVDLALNLLYSSKQFEILEKLFNNQIIPKSPMNSFFTEPYTAEMWARNLPPHLTFIEFWEIKCFQTEISKIIYTKNCFDDSQFSKQQVHLLTLLYKYGKSSSWKDNLTEWHLTFVLNAVIKFPMIFLHSVAKLFDSDAVPELSKMAISIYNDLLLIHPELLHRTLKRMTNISDIPKCANYQEFTEKMVTKHKGNMLLLSPDNVVMFLQKICNEDGFKKVNLLVFKVATAIIKNHILKPVTSVNWTFFWLFYGKYMNFESFRMGNSGPHWISIAYSLLCDMENLNVYERSYQDIMTYFIEYFNNQGLTEDMLCVTTSVGHIHTVDLLLRKMMEFLTEETYQQLLWIAAKHDFNGITSYYLNKFTYPAKVVQKIKKALDTLNGIEQKEEIDGREEQSRKKMKVEEENDVLITIINAALAEDDNEMLLTVITETDETTINPKTADKALYRVLEAKNLKAASTMLSHWDSLFSEKLRRNVIDYAVEKLPDEFIVLLMQNPKIYPDLVTQQSVYLKVVKLKSCEIINLFLCRWKIHTLTHDKSLLVAVENRDIHKLFFLGEVENTDFSNVGAVDAFKRAIEIGAYDVVEFMRSENFNLEFDEYLVMGY